MKRILTICLAVMAPLGVAGGLIYKIVHGEVDDPMFFILLVIVPSTLVSAIHQVTAALPPDRIRVSFPDRAEVKNWEWQPAEYTRSFPRTSVLLPLRLENGDGHADITLLDVEVLDRSTGARLKPPEPHQITVEGQTHWVYGMPGGCRKTVFNAGRRVVPKASVEDDVIMLEEKDVHRAAYDLEIRFRDNYGRSYTVTRQVAAETKG